MKSYLELADIELMEQTASCLRDRRLIRLLFCLGCRVSEALALKASGRKSLILGGTKIGGTPLSLGGQ